MGARNCRCKCGKVRCSLCANRLPRCFRVHIAGMEHCSDTIGGIVFPTYNVLIRFQGEFGVGCLWEGTIWTFFASLGPMTVRLWRLSSGGWRLDVHVPRRDDTPPEGPGAPPAETIPFVSFIGYSEAECGAFPLEFENEILETSEISEDLVCGAEIALAPASSVILRGHSGTATVTPISCATDEGCFCYHIWESVYACAPQTGWGPRTLVESIIVDQQLPSELVNQWTIDPNNPSRALWYGRGANIDCDDPDEYCVEEYATFPWLNPNFLSAPGLPRPDICPRECCESDCECCDVIDVGIQLRDAEGVLTFHYFTVTRSGMTWTGSADGMTLVIECSGEDWTATLTGDGWAIVWEVPASQCPWAGSWGTPASNTLSEFPSSLFTECGEADDCPEDCDECPVPEVEVSDSGSSLDTGGPVTVTYVAGCTWQRNFDFPEFRTIDVYCSVGFWWVHAQDFEGETLWEAKWKVPIAEHDCPPTSASATWTLDSYNTPDPPTLVVTHA